MESSLVNKPVRHGGLQGLGEGGSDSGLLGGGGREEGLQKIQEWRNEERGAPTLVWASQDTRLPSNSGGEEDWNILQLRDPEERSAVCLCR